MNIKCRTKIINGAPATSMNVQFVLVDGADAFAWQVTLPLMSDADIAAYLDSRREELRCKIYSAQYPGAVPGQSGNETLLESWRRWELNGCRNVDGTIVTKCPWNNTFQYDIHADNYKAVKAVKIRRLLKKGLLGKALKEKGEL